MDQALERHGRQKTRPRQTPAGCVEVMMIMVGLCSRALAEGPPKMLPQRKTYRPSGYRAIQRLYLGRNLNRRRKRETRNQKSDLPRKVYPAIQVSEYNPSLKIALGSGGCVEDFSRAYAGLLVDGSTEFAYRGLEQKQQ